MTYSRIAGTGSYLPEKVLTNADLEAMVDTTDEWIVARTGISERRIAAEDETSASMAEQSSLKALEAAGVNPDEVELIIVATTTPAKQFPGSAIMLQNRLGAGGCIAFDLNASACAGFSYAMSIADQYIKTGMVKNALVVGSEVMSRVLDWTDRSTCILFGDGAGSVVLTASEEPGVMSTHLHADGQYEGMLYLPRGKRSERDEKNETPFMKMEGSSLFKVAVNTLGKLFDETLTSNNIEKQAIDWLVPHQANLRIIKGMAKKLNLSMDNVAMTLAQHGNTSSASIPLALDSYIRDGKIKRGDLLLVEGFGGGLSWGSALVKY